MGPPAEWLPPTQVLDALEGSVRHFGSATVWKSVALRQGQAPEQITPDVVLSHTIAAARWNPRDVPALYTALERETAAAEGARLKENQEDPDAPSGLTLMLAPLQVHLETVADVSAPERLPDFGLTEADVRAEESAQTIEGLDRTSATQSVGGAAWYLGYAGILVPSARRWPATNLVVFPDRLGAMDFYAPSDEDR